MDKLQKTLADIQQQMADPDIYSAEKKKQLNQLILDEGKTKDALEETEMLWLDNQESLESAQLAFEQQMNG